MPKGKKYGGRKKGTPNKANREAAERARIEVENAAALAAAEGGRKRGPVAVLQKKLGKEMLEDYAMAFHTLAAWYQNRIVRSLAKEEEPTAADLAGFKQWGGMVVDTAEAVAEFQSPKFRAVMITPPPESVPPPRLVEGNVIRLDDPVALGRVYQRMVKSVR